MKKTLVSILILTTLINFSGCATMAGRGKTPMVPEPNFTEVLTERPAIIPARLAWGADGSLDEVNNKPAQKLVTVIDKAKVKLLGWSGNIENGTVPQNVYLEFKGPISAYFKITTRLKRSDVVAYFKKPGLKDSGWVAYANLATLPAGIYKVKIIQIEGKTGSLSDTRRSLKLIDSVLDRKNKSSTTKS